MPPKVAQVQIRCEAPDGAIADGFASRNGRTIWIAAHMRARIKRTGKLLKTALIRQ
jgi:hypothetical protein